MAQIVETTRLKAREHRLAVVIGLVYALFQAPRTGQSAPVKLAADLAHLIAFPLGWATGKLAYLPQGDKQ